MKLLRTVSARNDCFNVERQTPDPFLTPAPSGRSRRQGAKQFKKKGQTNSWLLLLFSAFFASLREAAFAAFTETINLP